MIIESNILTPASLNSPEEGKLILDLICDLYPGITPERYGNYEPMKYYFDPAHREDALTHWGDPFLWRRKKPRAEGSVWMISGPLPQHGWITLTLHSPNLDLSATITLFKALCRQFNPDYAYLHSLVEQEIEFGKKNRTVSLDRPRKNEYSLFVGTQELIKYVPDLYWATVFGKPYIDLFKCETMLTAPAFLVEQLDADTIYIQLSESLHDMELNFPRVNTVRTRVKAHLNHNVFFDPNLPRGHRYNVPRLNLKSGKPILDFARMGETLKLDFDQ